jgi:hypothetical protein
METWGAFGFCRSSAQPNVGHGQNLAADLAAHELAGQACKNELRDPGPPKSRPPSRQHARLLSPAKIWLGWYRRSSKRALGPKLWRRGSNRPVATGPWPSPSFTWFVTRNRVQLMRLARVAGAAGGCRVAVGMPPGAVLRF